MSAKDIFLRAVKKAESVNKLSKIFGMSQSGANKMAIGRSAVSPYRAAQAADILGEDSTKAAFQALADQARTPKERDYWLGKLSIAMLAFIGAMQPNLAEAKTNLSVVSNTRAGIYIVA